MFGPYICCQGQKPSISHLWVLLTVMKWLLLVQILETVPSTAMTDSTVLLYVPYSNWDPKKPLTCTGRGAKSWGAPLTCHRTSSTGKRWALNISYKRENKLQGWIFRALRSGHRRFRDQSIKVQQNTKSSWWNTAKYFQQWLFRLDF